MKLRRRYLIVPAVILAIASIPIMVIDPTPFGIVIGGFMFTVGVVLWVISQVSPHDGFMRYA